MDQYLVNHCAPTLASLKSANMFTVSLKPNENPEEWIAKWNDTLKDKGVSAKMLRRRQSSALIYVYRRDRVEADLRREGVREILDTYGYPSSDVEKAIEYLKVRIGASEEFPHEIGLFLGYPVGDVIGFIENRGKNCKCSGCWKVYCDECWAKKQFARFDKCREVYMRVFAQGREIPRMTVAAAS